MQVLEELTFIEIEDGLGNKGSLQESKMSDHLWIGKNGHRLHLDEDQVSDLITDLQLWLETGSLKGY